MQLNCNACGQRHVLSEEEVVILHPHFLCFSCGRRVPFPIGTDKASALRGKVLREARLPEMQDAGGSKTVLRFRRPTVQQGSNGS